MTTRIKLPISEIVARYEAGESAYALERAYGVSERTIQRRLRAAGAKVRRGAWPPARGGPLFATFGGYLATYDRERKQCRVHRGCWEAHHGPIPPGLVVHHVNGAPLDNRIENLEMMTWGAHTALHKTAKK